MYNLTPAEHQVISAAQAAKNPSIFTNYFIRNRAGGYLVYPGSRRYDAYSKHWNANGKPDKFLAESAEITFPVRPKMEDGNLLFFEERGYVCLPWQLDFYRHPEKSKVIIGLSGTGKTLGMGMLAMYMCATIPHFRFLNLAPNQYQSNLMEREIKQRIEESDFRQKFLKPGKAGIRYRPYVEYRFNNGSVAEFMNVALNADNVQSWSGDYINLDEAGLLEKLDGDGKTELENIMIGLASRLRGERPDGRPRMSVMSIISMAYPNDTLWEYYERGQDPLLKGRSWSKKIFHSDNPYLTPEYLQYLRDHTPPGLEGMWLRGEPPPRTGREFSDQMMNNTFVDKGLEVMKATIPDIQVEEAECGVVTFIKPREPGHLYVIAGDPGISDPPARNSPVIVVFDVTNFPKRKAELAAFWWGFPRGRYSVFIEMFGKLASDFAIPPEYRGYDSTGTQKLLAELSNISGDMQVIPMDFTGGRKFAYLSAMKLLMGKGLWSIPGDIWGIKTQIKNYQLPDTKMPQDIVSALAMVAFLMYPLYLAEYPDGAPGDEIFENSFGSLAAGFGRYARSKAGQRYTRAYGRPV